MKKFKDTIYRFIEKEDKVKWYYNSFSYFILILIILNVIAVMLQSVENINKKYHTFFYWFELCSVVIFTIEYILRSLVAEFSYKNTSKLKSKFKFIFSFFGLIDLLAILPFYLPMFIPFDLRFVRILRLLRLFRFLKVARYSKSLNIIGKVLKQKKEAILLTLFVCFLLIMVASCLMYYIERESQPEAFPDIFSSLWWAVVTLTTVGYGDVIPVTVAGKFISSIIAILGIGLVALPTGIIGAGFVELMDREKMQKEKSSDKSYCPYCGKRITE